MLRLWWSGGKKILSSNGDQSAWVALVEKAVGGVHELLSACTGGDPPSCARPHRRCSAPQDRTGPMSTPASPISSSVRRLSRLETRYWVKSTPTTAFVLEKSLLLALLVHVLLQRLDLFLVACLVDASTTSATRKFCMHRVLNKLYLQNLFIDRCNFAR